MRWTPALLALAACATPTPELAEVPPFDAERFLAGPRDDLWACTLGRTGTTVHYGRGYWVTALWDAGRSGVAITHNELEPSRNESDGRELVGMHDVLSRHESAHPIDALAARHGHELYLASTAPGGETVIERWTLPPQEHAYAVSKPSSEPVLGVAVPVARLEIGVVGGAAAYLPPDERPPPPEPVREELWRSAEVAAIAALAVDPEGRFLLFRTARGPDLMRLTLSESPVLETLHTPETLAILNHDEVRFRSLQHRTFGRILQLTGNAHDALLEYDVQVLFDAANDGVFERASPPFVGDSLAGTIHDSSNWTEDFVHHPVDWWQN